MKIGIITFWETQDNYGQMMQAYALQRVVEDLGHQPFLIRYSLFSDWAVAPDRWKSLFSAQKVVWFLKKKLFPSANTMTSSSVDRQFNAFKESYLKSSPQIYHSLQELRENPPLADVYICGSDQIWYACENYAVYRNITRAYFLDFGDEKIRRIAYAPSFGRTDYPQGYCDYIAPLLKRLHLVTVREKGGLEVCRRAGCQSALQVLDPTCLLSASDYSRISLRPDSKQPYILCYLLGSSLPDIHPVISFAQEHNLKIKFIGSQGDNPALSRQYPFIDFIYPTVNEWLGWIECCELMVTNSFHGSVFSILYNKRNVIVTANGLSRKGNDDRFYSLLEQLGLLDRIFTGNNLIQLLQSDCDYASVNSRLDKLRKQYITLLDNAIDK